MKFSEWAAPLVPVLQSDRSMCLCGDYKVTVNSVANVELSSLPRIDDLLASLTGGKIRRVWEPLPSQMLSRVLNL